MIRFLVFTDLHYDDVNDGDNRIDEILETARQRDPDFIVSLGDLCTPAKENASIPERFRSSGKPFYSVIGNHETARYTLSEITDFYSIKDPYYSVVCNEYKLLFLNTCYVNLSDREEIFYKDNFRSEGAVYPVLPAEEVRWLKRELSDDMKYIVFSHHSLVNDFPKRGVYNRKEVRKLFEGRQVLLCLNGHDHGDAFSFADKVPYMTVNSANYAWLGTQIASSPELQEKYSYLQGMLQYKQAMSAYIEIDENEIRIYGMDGEYLSVTPDDIGLPEYRWNGVSIRPRISSHSVKI